jgi:glycerol kinase
MVLGADAIRLLPAAGLVRRTRSADAHVFALARPEKLQWRARQVSGPPYSVHRRQCTETHAMSKFVGALDQGTTSTRFMVFDHAGSVVAIDQREHQQVFPRPGWVEHDPAEIWTRTREVIDGALHAAGLTAADLAAVGITNQRETAFVWDRRTGQPVANAVVWQDTRTDALIRAWAAEHALGHDRFRASCGLPLATYFSGPKIRWILDNVPGARRLAESGDLLFGNSDAWMIWNLTGGPDGGRHVTDVTNASRTMLMDLRTLAWDPATLDAMGIPASMLPEIRSSSEVYGAATGTLAGVPVAGDLGDQQAALFGQTCFGVGDAKNTYGTGCFMLLNTGERIVPSGRGLLTTLAYRIGDRAPVYALEGSIAIAGALVQWLRDNLGLIASAAEVETLARTVDDNGGVYIVPAFSGLFAPYWRSDARGVIAGLTRFANRGHLARAALEAVAWQTREVLDAMNADAGVPLGELRVDGGMVGNELLMQFQADVVGVPVVRPRVAETTALGAAYAAGLAVGYWRDLEDLRANWQEGGRWEPAMDPARREREYAVWKKAVSRTFDWLDDA